MESGVKAASWWGPGQGRRSASQLVDSFRLERFKASSDWPMQRSASKDKGPHGLVPRPDHHLRERSLVVARQKRDVASCYGFRLSADCAFAFQYDDESVVVGRKILTDRSACIEADLDHRHRHIVLRRPADAAGGSGEDSNFHAGLAAHRQVLGHK